MQYEQHTVNAANYGRKDYGINPGFIVGLLSLVGAVTLGFSLSCSQWTVISVLSEEGLWVSHKFIFKYKNTTEHYTFHVLNVKANKRSIFYRL